MRVATSDQCSVSLASLKRDHTITDLLDYVEMLEWHEELMQLQAEEQG